MFRTLLAAMAVASLLFLMSCSSSSGKQPAAAPVSKADPNIEHGKLLFYGKCASCHMVNKELSGPALKGVEDRWPDKEKLYAFIRNSEAVIQNDKYARELWLKYNQTMMLPHPDLKDEDIRSILDYINTVAE